MNSETDPRQKNADLVASIIKDELRTCLASVDAGEVPPITIESMKKTMEEFLGDMDKRKIITKPDFGRDLKISMGEIPVYKITYKTQLNSIEFIKGEEDIKVKTFLSDCTLEEAIVKAPSRVEKNTRILDVVLDHYEEDRTRMNIEYYYRPVIDINYYTMNVVVKI